MSDLVLDVISAALLLGGGLIGVLGALGVLRFPDFYSRLHAAGMTDTLCALMIVAGLIMQTGLSLLTLKLALILLFLLFTAPTATHALARAALSDGVQPTQGGETGQPTDKASPEDRSSNT
ncbi:MAG: monovalent cation/H(+) antiporter subunit G [Wenzhouxiangella sp.]|nr:monovalent cation/H(+) antiporter subunit G [Wenzhouxiangella sp.]MDR9453828.1 monovalent cation/H(+) antiporter subunit G [Wenzhouxiangella sp.]